MSISPLLISLSAQLKWVDVSPPTFFCFMLCSVFVYDESPPCVRPCRGRHHHSLCRHMLPLVLLRIFQRPKQNLILVRLLTFFIHIIYTQQVRLYLNWEDNAIEGRVIYTSAF